MGILRVAVEKCSMLITSFPPIISRNSTVLILGSMPGQKSLLLQQYYAHPRNYFWRLMDDLVAVPAGAPYTERVERLKETGIALWDSLEYCERPRSSLDSRIVAETEVANDFPALFATNPAIHAICFNGKKSEQVFRKRVLPGIADSVLQRLDLISLPSTSPANAGFTYAQKLDRWRVIIDYLPGNRSRL